MQCNTVATEAATLFYQGYEKTLGREHPDTLTSVYCLAHLLAKQRDYKEFVLKYGDREHPLL